MIDGINQSPAPLFLPKGHYWCAIPALTDDFRSHKPPSIENFSAMFDNKWYLSYPSFVNECLSVCVKQSVMILGAPQFIQLLKHQVQKKNLVGGFNRLEKYESQWEGWSHIWKKWLKPPIRTPINSARSWAKTVGHPSWRARWYPCFFSAFTILITLNPQISHDSKWECLIANIKSH